MEKNTNNIVTEGIIKKPIPIINDEIWVDVKHASKYQVSNYGRVKHKRRSKCVSSCRPSSGNSLVTISFVKDDGVRYNKTLGHLVAEHFVNNHSNYKYIAYKDGDFTNNISSNIYYTECRQEHDKPTKVSDDGRTCTKCKNFLPWDEFCFSKRGIRDKHHVCNNCVNLYSNLEENAERRKIVSHEYYVNNKESHALKGREYYDANRERLTIKQKEWRERNRVRSAYRLKYAPVPYELFENKLTIEEDSICDDNGKLLVRCSNCREYFRPGYSAVQARYLALNSDDGAENRLYCSEECKKNCSVYGTREYRKGTIKRSSRSTDKWFVNEVLERDGFECQRCGATEDLEVHHIIPYKVNPILEADVDNGITYCKECHKFIHKNLSWCGYSYLRACGTQ